MSPPSQLRDGSTAELSGPEKEGGRKGKRRGPAPWAPSQSSLVPHLSAAIILVSLSLG